MRTAEEMVLAVHNRMDALERRQEKRRIAVAGSGCAVLAAILLALIADFGGAQHEVLPSAYSGASLLADSAGGYVLVALIAFMAGAVIVAWLRTRRKKKDNDKQE